MQIKWILLYLCALEILRFDACAENTTLSQQSTTEEIIDFCASAGTCQVSQTLDYPYCRCDDECPYFGDCCSDVDLDDGPIASNYSRFKGHLECFTRSNDDIFTMRSFFVVATCPSDSNEISSKCAHGNFNDTGSCVSSKEDGIMYKNRFCAECHNVTDYHRCNVEFISDNIIPFNQLDGLSKDEIYSMYLRKGKIYQLHPPKDTVVRPCIGQLKVNNSPRCINSEINPVKTFVDRHNTHYFRNIFCSPVDSHTICVGRQFDLDPVLYNLFPLTVLFSYKGRQAVTATETECLVWTQKMEDQGLCQHLETYINTDIWVDPFYITSSHPLTGNDYIMVSQVLFWSFQVEDITEVNEGVFHVNENGTKIYIESLNLKLTKRIFRSQLDGFKKNFNDITWNADFIDAINGYYARLTKTYEHEEPFDKFRSTTSRNKGNMYFVRGIFGKALPDRNSMCSDMKVGILRNISYGVEVRMDNCTPIASRYRTEPNADDDITVETILTYVFFSVSSIALGVLIYYNYKFEIVSGTAGNNLNNLSVSMFLANVVFVVGVGFNDIVEICYSISILLHYLWLSVFSFMTIAVISIGINLTRLSAPRPPPSPANKRFLTFVGLLVPLVFVIPAIVLDRVGPEEFSPGYQTMVCFPDEFPGNLIFFTGPIMLSLLLNLISLIIILVWAYKIHIEISMASKRSGLTNGKIFMRITCLSNLFWVTGIFGSYFDVTWLRYVFTYLCGLHGFFIAVASLSTTKAKQAIRKGTSVTDQS